MSSTILSAYRLLSHRWTQRCSCLCHKLSHKYLSNDARKLAGKLQSVKNVARQPVTTETNKIRNIGIMAHIDAGKTTTTERMLFYSGYTRHIGDVDDGDTVMDFMDQERDRGITITSAAITFSWKKHKINLIDTPGHVDFTLEVERSLRVLDGAVAVLDASAGVEAQTITVWRQADNYKIPRLVFINKMDKSGANFAASVQSLKESLQVKPLVLHLPMGQEQSFDGVMDIVNMEKILWKPGQEGRNYVRESISIDDKLYDETCAARTKLIESLADVDETIADLVLADADYLKIPSDVIHRAIRKATVDKSFVPILCGSALKNKGVQLLLDAILYYLPSPLDIYNDFVPLYKGKLCALAFKIVHDKQRGALTFARIYSGCIKSGETVYNVNRQSTEKTGRMVEIYADEYRDISQAELGNIVAISGLKETISGDTIVSSAKAVSDAKITYLKTKKTSDKVSETDDSDETEQENSNRHDPVLAGIHVPEPVFLCSIEPASMSQQKALEQALVCLTREDPSLRVSVNEETGQMILSGMGELHLEVVHHRIRNQFKVDADLGEVYIAYRETIGGYAEDTYVLDKQFGDTRHLVTVTLSVKPSENDLSRKDEKFLHKISPHPDSNISEKTIWIKHRIAVKHGILSALSRGPILHFPVVDVSVSLHDLKVGRGTSLPMVRAAVAQAVTQAMHKAQPKLMEPVMSLQVHTTDLHLGSVLKDLNQRRSQVLEVKVKGDLNTVVARTPLSELLGYSTALRTFTSGTASFCMELHNYEIMNELHQRNAVIKARGFL